MLLRPNPGNCFSKMVRLRLPLIVSLVGFMIIFQVYRKMNIPLDLTMLQDFDESDYNRIEENTPESMKDDVVAKRFAQRIQVMKSQCPNWRNSKLKVGWVSNKNFLIDVPRKFMVCAVPKSGSTTWHMRIWAARRMRAGLDPDTKFYNYSDTVYNHQIAGKLTIEQGRRLITYYDGDDDVLNPPEEKTHRLILARHPFARLISGWHQKFLPQSNYADFLFNRFPRLKPYKKHDDPNHQMAFEDFAKFVADYGGNPNSIDYHFTTAHQLCKPCDYAYTYILKAESVDIDEPWLLRRLNITDLTLGRMGVPPGGSIVNTSPSDNIKKYISKLRPDVIKRLYKIYEYDFRIFGYTFDFDTLESGGFE